MSNHRGEMVSVSYSAMVAYDALPLELRDVLKDTVLPWSAGQVLGLYEAGAHVEDIVRIIHRNDAAAAAKSRTQRPRFSIPALGFAR